MYQPISSPRLHFSTCKKLILTSEECYQMIWTMEESGVQWALRHRTSIWGPFMYNPGITKPSRIIPLLQAINILSLSPNSLMIS